MRAGHELFFGYFHIAAGIHHLKAVITLHPLMDLPSLAHLGLSRYEGKDGNQQG
jgi:hypothetical protein